MTHEPIITQQPGFDPGEKARQTMARIQSQAAELRTRMPAFDLARAMQDPRFVRLAAAGLSVEEAYLATAPALRAVYRAGVQQGCRQAAMERNQARPVENGSAPAGVVTGLDPAHLSKAQRRDIRSRVRRGEEITF